MEQGQSEVEISRDGIKVRGHDVTVILLVAITVGVAALVYMLHAHGVEAQRAGDHFVGAIKEQTTAIKEQTQAVRENTCMTIYKDADACRRITR